MGFDKRQIIGATKVDAPNGRYPAVLTGWKIGFDCEGKHYHVTNKLGAVQGVLDTEIEVEDGEVYCIPDGEEVT